MRLILMAFAVILIVPGCRDRQSCEQVKADLILYNANIITVDPDNPAASAVAVNGTKILAVGKDDDMLGLAGDSTQKVDLKGKTVIPGLIESHAHFMDIGYTKMKLDLTGAKTWNEIVDLVARAAEDAAPGEWILGRGWHQEKWIEPPDQHIEGYPVHSRLSAVSPANPVYLTHASGHAIVANEAAMVRANVLATTSDPEGGRILRLEDGSPAGVFLENAEDFILRCYSDDFSANSPEMQRQYEEKAFDLAVQTCLENGITTLHDAGASFETVDFFHRMLAGGRMTVRLYVMLGASNRQLAEKMAAYRSIGAGGNHLTIRSVKRFVDGALGAHGAWLLEPYADLPSSTGLNTTATGELRETARLAAENGYQLCTHAIGDRGIREMLDLYEPFIKGHDLRWRIEHAQHIDPVDLPRFAAAGVIAAMQANHATSDGPWVVKRLGEVRSREGAYAWRKLIDSGAVICNGTDAPVENINPMANFYAAVTRMTADGQPFFPEQAMTREETLKAYTINGAYAAFEEKIKGSVTPGKLADLTILSGDILTIPEQELPTVQIEATIIDGRFVYRASGEPE